MSTVCIQQWLPELLGNMTAHSVASVSSIFTCLGKKDRKIHYKHETVLIVEIFCAAGLKMFVEHPSFRVCSFIHSCV